VKNSPEFLSSHTAMYVAKE